VENLGQTERNKLFERFGRKYRATETIYEQGAAPDVCFIIQRGRVRLVTEVRSHERTLAVLKAGDLFGEEALLPRGRRGSTAIALTEVTALGLDANTFGALLTGNADVAGRMIGQLVQRLRLAEEQLENSMLSDPASRVVNTLLRVARISKKSTQGHSLPVSPLDLASRAGLDVDETKRTMQMLRDGGYVRVVQEQIEVPDLESLERLFRLLGRKEQIRGSLPPEGR